jgi:hypothetical protein
MRRDQPPFDAMVNLLSHCEPSPGHGNAPWEKRHDKI